MEDWHVLCVEYGEHGGLWVNGYQYLNLTACKKLSGDPKMFLGADIGQWPEKNREQIFFKGWIGSFEIYKGHVPNDIKGLIMRNLCQRFNLKYFTNDSYPNEDSSIDI